MQPHNLHLYFFSPTGGTKTVAGLFAEQLGAPDACTDITVHAEAKTFTADDRLLLFFPVYGGRVPEPCLARVRALRGADTPVTLVAVFGNRAVDDALLEMRDTLAPLGFRVVAAAEVIAPHSINTDIAIGRPDASDRAKIAAFCAQLASKLAEDAPAGITVPGNKPYCDYNGLPLKPTGGLRCISCGLCADNCPAGAIPKDAPKKGRQAQVHLLYALHPDLPADGAQRAAAAAAGCRRDGEKNTAPGARSRPSTFKANNTPAGTTVPAGVSLSKPRSLSPPQRRKKGRKSPLSKSNTF